MTDFTDLTWQEAMRHGHTALIESESLYEDINASQGRSNLDIEKHLRRAEVKATQAQVWLALASELGSQGERYGHPGPKRRGTMPVWPSALRHLRIGIRHPSAFGLWGSGVIAVDLTDRLYGRASKWRKA